MPTPFSHLRIAQELLALPGLAPRVRQALAGEEPAFLLGNIAPDVQTISGQAREATHFFPVPLQGAPPAHRRMLERYPALARPGAMQRAYAAFTAGYLAHLALDQLWVAQIFEPVFGEAQTWGSFKERLYLHNALRAYHDAAEVARLPGDIDDRLRRAEPRAWLPFVGDHHLRAWRDLVADQLGPGASRTLEVFAQRMGADPEAFEALVTSPEAMRRRVFTRVSPDQLDRYRGGALARCGELIQAYWDEAL